MCNIKYSIKLSETTKEIITRLIRKNFLTNSPYNFVFHEGYKYEYTKEGGYCDVTVHSKYKSDVIGHYDVNEMNKLLDNSKNKN